jgi:type IX secretion system PorP/SprF family membrane protein
MKYKLLGLKLLPIICFFLIYTEGVVAQQEGSMTLFMYNPWAVNPAAAGYRDLPSVVLYHRSQWLGFKGAPTIQSVNLNAPAFKSRRLGVSMGLTNRRAGYFQSQTGNLALSYSLIKTGNFAIRMGLQGSLRRFTTRFDQAEDILILQADRSIPPRLSTRYFGNIGFGTLATYGDSYLGFSVPFYLPSLIGINPYTTVTAAEAAHFYLMGGLSFQVAEGIALKPQAMIKYVKNAPWNIESNVSMMVKERITLGVSYRTGRTNIGGIGESASMTMMLQLNERYALGGAYDWIISPIGQFSYGSFEMLMRYDLKKKEIKMSNPRGF